MKSIINHSILGLALVSVSVSVSAGIDTYGDRTIFNAQGTIVYNSNFNDFDQFGFSFPGDPFTRGDVTYTSENNLIVGNSVYSIGQTMPVMSNNFWTPITGNILSSTNPYTLFGFDVAVTSGVIDITVTTNQASYLFSDLTVPDGSPSFAFEGFRATGAGEYFTGFRIDSLGSSYLPGMTNVAVGLAAPIPEPEIYAMMAAGLGLVGFIARRRREKAFAS